MKFSEFEPKKNSHKEELKANKIDANDAQEIESLYEKYSKMSYDQLMQEFLKVSRQERANGNLDEDRLQEIKQTLSPYLTEDAKAKMEDITKHL